MIQVFDFGGKVVRTAGTLEEPLFCGADVCAVLHLAGGAKNALADLDADERVLVQSTKAKTSGLPPVPPMVYVNESGLFSLILRSSKPEAKAFKRWITREVLPAIRKHGFYDALRAALTERGAVSKLAKDLGVDQSLVTRWTQRQRKPNTAQRVHIEREFGIKILDWDEEPSEFMGPTGLVKGLTIEREPAA